METNEFCLVKIFKTDGTDFELIYNKSTQFITILMFDDLENDKRALFFENKNAPIFSFSDYINLTDSQRYVF